jgi:hypothetical protein
MIVQRLLKYCFDLAGITLVVLMLLRAMFKNRNPPPDAAPSK